jgi:hypothetical protein
MLGSFLFALEEEQFSLPDPFGPPGPERIEPIHMPDRPHAVDAPDELLPVFHAFYYGLGQTFFRALHDAMTWREEQNRRGRQKADGATQ